MKQLDNYKIERICSNCGHHEVIEISKRYTAFKIADINKVLGQVCKKCSSTSFATSYQSPDLNINLFKERATSSGLYLMINQEKLT